MAKFLRGVNGAIRSYSIDQEVSVSSGVDNATVNFPASVGNSSYRIAAWLVNFTDSSPQFQPLTPTNRTATSFTVKWNDPTDSANYKIMYIVPDGFIS